MSDVKKLDERINNLESKLKAAFTDVETKISSLSTTDKDSIEERFQEVEDLILLLQVEQMKIKEKLHASIDIGFGGELSPEDTGGMKAVVDSLQNLVHEMDARLSAVENSKRMNITVKDIAVKEPPHGSSNILFEVNKILSSN